MNDDKTDYYHRSKRLCWSESDHRCLIGQQIQVRKNCFLAIAWRDYFFQGVAFKPNFIEKFGEEIGAWKIWYHQTLEPRNIGVCDISIVKDRRSKFGYELDIEHQVIGESQDCPILLKTYGTDFLMDNRHLVSSRKQVAVMQICNAIIYATYEFFDKNGFMSLMAQFFQEMRQKDSTELFENRLLEHSLFESIQVSFIWRAGAMALGRVFDFGPEYSCWKSRNSPSLLSSGWTLVLLLDTRWVTWLARSLCQSFASRCFWTVLLKLWKPWNVIQSSWNATLLNHSNGSPMINWSLARAWKWWRCGLWAFGTWWWLRLTMKLSFKPLWCANIVMNYPAAIKAFYMKPVPQIRARCFVQT